MSLQLLSSTGLQPTTFLYSRFDYRYHIRSILFLFYGMVLIMTALLTLFTQNIRESIF